MRNFSEENAQRIGKDTVLYNGVVRRKAEDKKEDYIKLNALDCGFTAQILEADEGYIYQKYEKGLSLARLSRKALSFFETVVLMFKIFYIIHILKKNNINYGELSPNKFVLTDDDKLILIGLGRGKNNTAEIFRFFKRLFAPSDMLLFFKRFKSDNTYRNRIIKLTAPFAAGIMLILVFFAACRYYRSETFKFEEIETTTQSYETQTQDEIYIESSSESTSETVLHTTTQITTQTAFQTTTEAPTEITTDDGSWEMEIIPGKNKNQNALIAIANPDPDYKGHIVYVKGSERNILERLVMGEAGSDYYAAALVAQCIRDAIVSDGYNSVTAVRRGLKYTGRITTAPTQSVKNAVAYIFDKGGNAIQHRILYFYAPRLVDSGWHEQQQFLFGYCGHKYFDRTTDPNNKRIHSVGKYNTLSYVKQETETVSEVSTEETTEESTEESTEEISVSDNNDKDKKTKKQTEVTTQSADIKSEEKNEESS